MDSRTEGIRQGGRLLLCCMAVAALATVHAGQGDEPKPDFSGTWTLDRNISSDPSQVEFLPRADANRRPQRGGIGGVGGFGRGGRRRAGGNDAESLTSVEQERLNALTDQLKAASDRLVISHHDPDFVINDAKNHTLFLHTTGAREENQL